MRDLVGGDVELGHEGGDQRDVGGHLVGASCDGGRHGPNAARHCTYPPTGPRPRLALLLDRRVHHLTGPDPATRTTPHPPPTRRSKPSTLDQASRTVTRSTRQATTTLAPATTPIRSTDRGSGPLRASANHVESEQLDCRR